MGKLRASADYQAAAARREEVMPKAEVLQSRLARAAAAFCFLDEKPKVVLLARAHSVSWTRAKRSSE